MCQMWTQIPCFARTFQLTIKAALKSIALYADISKKCRYIMEFFAESTSAREEFKQIQILMNPNNRPLQLLQEMNTRWNSAHILFEV